MGEPEVERLLQERAGLVARERPLSPDAERSVRSELASLARQEIAREARLRRFWLAVLPLAAAAVIVVWAAPWKVKRYGRAEIELALLDESRRPLESVVRGPASTGSTGRVQTVSIELVAVQTAYVALFAWDPEGERHDLDASGALDADTDRYVTLDLAEFAPRSEGESVVSVLAVSSKRPVPEGRLEALLPATIDGTGREGRERRLHELCGALERKLDCTTEVASFVLAK